MARVGIDTSTAWGVSLPNIRRVAERAGRDHELALALWMTEVHEARQVAGLVADPARFTKAQMNGWAANLDSWDVCDLVADAFAESNHAEHAIGRWSRARHGYTKRCAFAMIARAAVWSDDPDDRFVAYLPLIEHASDDERNEVKKAVNWALRQIGKRNRALHDAAIAEAETILAIGTRSGRWIARDALRELRDPRVIARIRA
jgi:3-methyladenine DNA glycosylase AlkD